MPLEAATMRLENEALGRMESCKIRRAPSVLVEASAQHRLGAFEELS